MPSAAPPAASSPKAIATAERKPVATSAPASRAKSMALAREYAARLRALLAAVDSVEEAAMERVVEDLRALRDALVKAATGGGVGGTSPSLGLRLSAPGAAASSPSALDPSSVISQIDAAIRTFQARMTATLLAAQLEAINAGTLTIDGVLRPAVTRARKEAAEKRARAPRAEDDDRRADGTLEATPSPSTTAGGDLFGRGPGSGGGGSGGRLPPVSLTTPPAGFGGGGPNLPRISVVGVHPVIPDGVREAAAALAAEEVTTLTTKLRQEMAMGIRRAALGGLSPLEVMREVDKALPGATRGAVLTAGVGSSAERILRTQLSRVFSKSADARAKGLAGELRGAGYGKGAAAVSKQWIATMDSRTRASHLAAHGQTVGVDDDFEVDGEALGYPGDPKGSASNVISCRCRMVTVLPENPEDLFVR